MTITNNARLSACIQDALDCGIPGCSSINKQLWQYGDGCASALESGDIPGALLYARRALDLEARFQVPIIWEPVVDILSRL